MTRQPGEKRCRDCGRVGTAAFEQVYPNDPSWMGPYRCYWRGSCQRRIAASIDRQAREERAVVDAVDLDALQDTPDTE